MAQLKNINDISIDLNIIPEDDNNTVNCDAKIKEVERTGNYELKLILEDDNGSRGFVYIKVLSSHDYKGQIKGRNILNDIQSSPKIIGVPLCVLPKLDLEYFTPPKYY